MGAKWGRWTACWFSSQMSSTTPCGTPWFRLTWLWRPSVRRYNQARVSLCTLRKQPFQQTRVRWGDFPLIPNSINYIKSRSRNREAGLWYPEIIGPPDKHKHINIGVKPSHNQEEEETEDSIRNMERQNVVSAGIWWPQIKWNPQGRRSRGRPNATWRRTILTECEKTSFGELRAQASNCHWWNLKADGLCSTGVWL